MRNSLLLLLPLLGLVGVVSSRSPSGPEPSTQADVTIQDLSWMAGTWRHTDGGEILEETWGKPNGDAIVGMFQWVGDGQTSLFELMAIEESEEHGLVYRIRHFSPGLEPWKSELKGAAPFPLFEYSDTRVVFENLEDTQVRRVVYERSKDRLNIRVEFPDESSPLLFEFERAK